LDIGWSIRRLGFLTGTDSRPTAPPLDPNPGFKHPSLRIQDLNLIQNNSLAAQGEGKSRQKIS